MSWTAWSSIRMTPMRCRNESSGSWKAQSSARDSRPRGDCVWPTSTGTRSRGSTSMYTEERMIDSIHRVVLLSLDPWDEVWRRNQHLAVRLVRLGLVESLVFV